MPIRAANPDRLLKRFCRTGDPAALGTLFDRTAAELLRVAVWLCGNRIDAEDLLQRTFVSVIEARASVRVLTSDGSPAALLQVRGQGASLPAIYPHFLPGSYELECQASDGRETKGRIVVRSADEQPSVTLELPRR